MLYRCLLYIYFNLDIYWGYFVYKILFYYAIYFPHVLLFSILCSKRGILILFLFSTYCFLINAFFNSTDMHTVLYFYALPIDHHLHSFLSLYLSCNLS